MLRLNTLVTAPDGDLNALPCPVARWRQARFLIVVLGAMSLGHLALADGKPGPQKAIERLEGCSKQELKQGCVNILLRRNGENGKREIKAEIRGGRIIWYEYDKRSGSVRRLN